MFIVAQVCSLRNGMSREIKSFMVTISSHKCKSLTLNRAVRNREKVLWVEILFDLPELFQAEALIESFANLRFLFDDFF